MFTSCQGRLGGPRFTPDFTRARIVPEAAFNPHELCIPGVPAAHPLDKNPIFMAAG